MFNLKYERIQKNLKKKETISILLIFIWGFFLRIYNLSSKTLWRDEIWTLRHTDQSLKGILYTASVDVRPPLYYISIKSVRYFNDTPFILRLPSVIFGTLAILLIYKISSRFFGTNTALLSAFLVSISPLHISYSQFARNYTMLTFLSLSSLYFLCRILENDKSSAWIYFTISNILVIYTHYIGLFILLAEAVFFFAFNYKKDLGLFKKFLLSLAITGAAFVPWSYYVFLHRNSWNRAPHFDHNPQIGWMPYIFYKYSIGLRRTTIVDRKYIIIFATPIFFFAFLKGVYASLKEHKLENYLFISYIFVPYFATFFISFFMINIFFFRFLMFIIPVYLMFVANGITKTKNKKIATILLLGLVILHAYILYDYYFLVDKVNWYYSVGL